MAPPQLSIGNIALRFRRVKNSMTDWGKSMDSQRWYASQQPEAMLKWLREQNAISDAEARLFAVACLRRVSWLLDDERSREAVAIAERFANGEATSIELTCAERAAEAAYEDTRPECEAARAKNKEIVARGEKNCPSGRAVAVSCAALAAAATCRASSYDAAGQCWFGAMTAIVSANIPLGAEDWQARWDAIEAEFAEVLREMVTPFGKT